MSISIVFGRGAAKVAVHRMRVRYREIVRELIADTVSEPSEVDEEWRLLLAALLS